MIADQPYKNYKNAKFGLGRTCLSNSKLYALYVLKPFFSAAIILKKLSNTHRPQSTRAPRKSLNAAHALLKPGSIPYPMSAITRTKSVDTSLKITFQKCSAWPNNVIRCTYYST